MDVLYEDNHLLVINKPAGIVTMGDADKPSVHQTAVDYIRQKYNKPGKVYLGIVSRLDALTTGVLVLARTSKAASRLVPQFGETQRTKKNSDFLPAKKIYLGVIDGALDQPSGVIENWVYKDDSSHRMRVAEQQNDITKLARLRYITIDSIATQSIIAVVLETGRKHQIRLQFAELGHPILGDHKYESRTEFPAGVALHSWQTTITHPTRREPITFTAPLPNSWGKLHERIGSSTAIEQLVNEISE